MQSQMTYTRAKTLGPFLTLILTLSERGRALSEALRPVSPGSATPDYVPLAAREETFHETKSAPRPLRLGPILTLILTAERHQPEGLPELAVRV
jgi:hypothetical protein